MKPKKSDKDKHSDEQPEADGDEPDAVVGSDPDEKDSNQDSSRKKFTRNISRDRKLMRDMFLREVFQKVI